MILLSTFQRTDGGMREPEGEGEVRSNRRDLRKQDQRGSAAVVGSIGEEGQSGSETGKAEPRSSHDAFSR
jgi:hypothetical protein